MTSGQETTLLDRTHREGAEIDSNEALTSVSEDYRMVSANTVYPTSPWKWAALTVILGGLGGLVVGFSTTMSGPSFLPGSPILFSVYIGVTLTATVADWYWYYCRASTNLRQRCVNTALGRGCLTFGVAAMALIITAIGVTVGTVLIVWFLAASFLIVALIMSGFVLAALYSLLSKDLKLLSQSIGGTLACMIVLVILTPVASVATEGILDSRGLSGLVIGSLLVVGALIPEYRASRELRNYIQPLQEAVSKYDDLCERLEEANNKLPEAYQSSLALEPFDPLEYDSMTTVSEDLELLASDVKHIGSYGSVYSQIDEQLTEWLFSKGLTETNSLHHCCRVLHPDRYESTAATDAAVALFTAVTERLSILYTTSPVNTKELLQEQSHPFFEELQKQSTKETLEHTDVNTLETKFKSFEQDFNGYELYWELESRLDTLCPKYETTIESLTESPLTITAAEYHPSETARDTIKSALQQTVVLESLCSVAEEVLRIESQYTSVTATRVTGKLRQRVRALCSAESSATINDVKTLTDAVEQIERCCVLAERSPAVPTEDIALSITTWGTGTSKSSARQRRETTTTLLTQCERITEFIERVGHTHPTIKVDAWTTAMQSAVRGRSPGTLRPIVDTIDRIGERVWERSHLFDVHWETFEQLVGSLYRQQGYTVTVTQGTNDEGVDVWARRGDERLAIQVKQYSHTNVVGRPVLQRIASTIAKGDATRAVVVTSSTFAQTAETYAAEFGPAMTVIDGDELLRQFSESDIVPPS